MTKTITVASAPSAIPGFVLAFHDMMTHPQAAIATVVLLMQGVFLGIKIWRELKGKKDNE